MTVAEIVANPPVLYMSPADQFTLRCTLVHVPGDQVDCPYVHHDQVLHPSGSGVVKDERFRQKEHSSVRCEQDATPQVENVVWSH